MLNIIPPDDTPLKQCSKCKKWKPATLEYFHQEKKNSDGFRSDCRICRNKPKDNSIPEGYKRCSKCKEVKIASLEYFPGTKHTKSGLYASCKVCNNAYCKEYRENNVEKTQERLRSYQQSHPEQFKAYNRRYQQEHPEQFMVYNRQYRQEHPEQFRARSHKRRALKMGAEGVYTAQDIQNQYQRQRGFCYYCKKRLGKKYHVDHIIPLSRGGTNWPHNLVLACPFCNQSKKDKLLHEWIEGGRLL